ncbi:MAG: NPCBM/NEW2 domain-containing protein [Thermoguttaceae bacterium]
MHAFLSLMVLSAFASVPQFDVQLLDGSRVSGSLVAWDAARLVVESSAGRTALNAGKLVSVTPQMPPATPTARPAVWVDLVDGSQLAAAEYTAENGRAKIAFSATEVLEVPTAEIDAVRLQPASEATGLEWSRIRGQKTRGDVLVTGNSNAIDYHQGAIENVTDSKARFILDGQALGVKRAKIFGLIYFHATAATTLECPYKIVDSRGSRWAAASLKFSEGKIDFTSPGGRTTCRGLDQIVKIDLSCGKIVYLSDLKTDSETCTPYPFTVTGKELPSRLEFSRVRRDQNLESKSLRILGQVYRKGLALGSRSELAWTLSGKFGRLEGVAGIDDDVRPLGNVRLQILGDGKTLLDANIVGNEDAKKGPTLISLDVSGVRRLVLIVESLGNFGAGDHLDLGNLRLIK